MGRYLDIARVTRDCEKSELSELSPERSKRAATLTPATVATLIEHVCHGLAITPEQLRAELADDLADIESGALTPKALRLVARTLAVMRYGGRA